MTELSKTYEPKEVEDKWYAWWEENNHFHGDPEQGGDPYCIVIPPPNVTGILHMGHALNSTIQDVLIRWKKMQGKNTVWIPGTDHAGIATQNVVERALRKENLTRDDLGREEFIGKVWEWKHEYGETITRQLRKLGAACDWERERFTMDAGLSNAVAETFIRLYNKGLIYRGHYIINWCPRCQTALSDEESEHRDLNGKLYHIKYPIKGGKKKDFVIVATTRPETMLGDTAVAVNPRDDRYRGLVKATVVLPVLNRDLQVIEDDFVDPEFGTGVVKVTPAHDPNDFDMGQRHELETINVMNPDGTMNENAGPYAGMDRFDCRKKLVADLEAAKLLVQVEDHAHAVGHCYRCDTMVEPYLSDQWFVKMKPLARPALEAVKDGRIKFVPERWNKVYLEWMENIRDWCISRQIWWGHRIPVFYCDACGHEWAAKGEQTQCPKCASDQVRQDEDVLDTWFSSWLWPFSVFGWPEQSRELDFYYPSDTLVTASEIIFFWVARMIMSGMEFMGEIPFSKVYIHGTVRDDHGLKMSKSLGNSIDPLDIIEKYSADALRFSLTVLTATGQDVYLSDEKFEIGRNFATKMWNAARFMQMHQLPLPEDFAEPAFNVKYLTPDDKHLIHHLHRTISSCDENLSRFRFNDYAKDLYEFLWHKYCDWYVEYSKQVLYGDDEARKTHIMQVMHYAFATAIKLLHPVMPHLTEELWHKMGYGSEQETIMNAPWPKVLDSDELKKWKITGAAVNYVDAKHDIIRVGRTLKSDYGIAPGQKVEYFIKPSTDKFAKFLAGDEESLALLLRASALTVDEAFLPGKAMPSGISKIGNIYMSIEELVDVSAEVARLTGQMEKITSDLEKVSRKLENISFINKAPKEVVDHQKNRRKELLEKNEKLVKLITTLSEGK